MRGASHRRKAELSTPEASLAQRRSARAPGARCFSDRDHAGRCLADLLERFRVERPIVLGIPRGGVAVAAVVADSLGAALDVAVVRKLGAPGNPEFAIGALAEGGVQVLSKRALRALQLSEARLAGLICEVERDLAERVSATRGARAPLALARRTVILVDDGLATGHSALAGVISLRRRGAERVILAVPIAARAALAALAGEVEEVVCVESPVELRAVGHWYEDFSPISDAEVESALAGRARGAEA
jgi:putative phosphoribosyl transferase